MLRRRRILLCVVLLVVGGSLSATLISGLYLRSGLHADNIADRLTLFFELPTEIGAVAPLGLEGKLLGDVVVFLPDRRGRVFHGHRVIWKPREHAEENGYELRVEGGSFLIESDRWDRDDYRLVLESGLGHDFADLNLDRVELRGLDFNWRAGNVALATRDASGTVVFDSNNTGQASLLSTWLNDRRVAEPISIFARFRTDHGVQMEQVTLDAPRIPLSALGLEGVLCAESPAGSFSGKITYREQGESQSIELSGLIDGLRLEDLRELVPSAAPRGRVRIQVTQGLIRDGKLEKLQFAGRIDEVDLSPLASLIALPDLGGRATLFVHQGEISGQRVSWLGMSGKLEGVSLDGLTELLGRGRITGSLHVEMPSLVINDNRLESAELRITAEPPADRPGLISRRVLKHVVEQFAGFSIPNFLPENLEYTQLGARLVVEGRTLRVLGTHGARNTTILTAKVLGQEVGLLFQPARNFDIGPFLDRLQLEAEKVDVDRLRDWWEAQPAGLRRPLP